MYHLRSTYKNRLDFPFKRLLKQASKLTGVQYSWEDIGFKKIVKKVEDIMSNPNHPMHGNYIQMRSGMMRIGTHIVLKLKCL